MHWRPCGNGSASIYPPAIWSCASSCCPAGARYLGLDPAAWCTAHMVFAAMCSCEPAESALDTLARHNQSLEQRTQASLRQHDVSLVTYHHNLAAYIRADLRALAQAVARNDRFGTPPRLLRIDEEHRAAFSFLLQRSLRIAADWAENKDLSGEHRDLRIYAGNNEVRAHLVSLLRRDDGRRLTDARRGRSRQTTADRGQVPRHHRQANFYSQRAPSRWSSR